MPITHTDTNGVQTVTHTFQVVQVRKCRATRNLSDTLDYSDYQTVDVTEALVYMGTTKNVNDYEKGYMVVERPILERFEWIDCSNLFTWRGADVMIPTVDKVLHPDVVINYVHYREALTALENARAEEMTKRTAEKQRAAAEAEKNRPVKGKDMVVVSGRKVKPGTVGTVAYVSEDGGRVLLKDKKVWQDRKADGIWVQARHLKAV